jgi:hypothetical protein
LIQLPRHVARTCRAVFRRVIGRRGGLAPPVALHSGPEGLRLCLLHPEVAVEYRTPDAGAAETLYLPADALAAIEGRGDDPVTLEAAGENKVLARWQDAGVPQAVEHDVPDPQRVGEFPTPPEAMAGNPATLLRALDDAARTTAQDSARYALQRLQLRGGKRGEVVATDGRQLLVQGGFSFPWDGDVLVPCVTAFGCHELPSDEVVKVGKTPDHVVLRVGAWTFALRIDTASHFPDVGAVIPRPRPDSTRWQIGPEDAAFLARALPRLPGADNDTSPVTVDLDGHVVLRARAHGQGPTTEVVLACSTCTGKPARVCLDRRLLARALGLGFTEVMVVGPDAPLLCREGHRTYLWMPLGQDGALGPCDDDLRIVSSDSAPVPPSPVIERRSTMSAPNANTPPARNGAAAPADPPQLAAGVDQLIDEAEALRAALAEAHARAGRLVGALKHQRRQGRALEAALQSLRSTLQPSGR